MVRSGPGRRGLGRRRELSRRGLGRRRRGPGRRGLGRRGLGRPGSAIAVATEQLSLGLGAVRYAQPVNDFFFAHLTFLRLRIHRAVIPRTGANEWAREVALEAPKAFRFVRRNWRTGESVCYRIEIFAHRMYHLIASL